MESHLKISTSKSAEQQQLDLYLSAEDDPKTLQTQTRALLSNRSIEDVERKCAAFVRYDVYGKLGRGELTWPEKFLLAIGLVFLVPARVAAGMSLLVAYYVVCWLCTAFGLPDNREDYGHMRGWRRAVIVRSGRFLSRLSLLVFGFYWISETTLCEEVDHGRLKYEAGGAESEESERPGAIVSNHISYVDILYHMSFSFPSFVAKRSVAKLPLVGLISKCLGCVYVQRELKSSDFKGVSGIVNERILEAQQDKLAPQMMLFPEGTTTNGCYLLPFKTGAFLAKAPVLPIILRYPYQRFSVAWDSISWVRHLFFLLCQFVNYIEVTKLPVYHPSEEEKEDPKLYAENVRKLMALEGNLILSDVGLAEKRLYLAALDGSLSKLSGLHQKKY